MVYFIQEESGAERYIKIGYSNVPSAGRLKSLGTGNPRGLALTATLKLCGRATEQALHQYFRRDRIRGEWFAPSARLLRFISWVNAHQDATPREAAARLAMGETNKHRAEKGAEPRRKARNKKARMERIQAEADTGQLTLRNITQLAERTSICSLCSEEIFAGESIAKSAGIWAHEECA